MSLQGSTSTKVFLKVPHESNTFPRILPAGTRTMELEEFKSLHGGPPRRKEGMCSPCPPRSLSFNAPSRTSPRITAKVGNGSPNSPKKTRFPSTLNPPVSSLTSSPKGLSIPSPTGRRLSQCNESKIAILGLPAVGKSALVVRLLTGRFIYEYDPTLEATYRYQTRVEDENIVMEVLDTAGEFDDENLKDSHIQWAEGFILVFSLTDRNSFENIRAMHDRISTIKNQQNFPCTVFANKDDLVHLVEVLPSECTELGTTLDTSVISVSACEGSRDIRTGFHDLHRDITRRRAARRRRSSAKLVMEGFVKIFSR